jgi:hypothetical protein
MYHRHKLFPDSCWYGRFFLFLYMELKLHSVVYRHHEEYTCIFNYTCQSLRGNTAASKITNKLTVNDQGFSSHERRYCHV